MRQINLLVIHHSATLSGSVERFRAEHRARGYADIGYHNLIGNGSGMPDGHIAAGRPHEVVGAGVWGANAGKLHVCLVGDFHRAGWEGRHKDEVKAGAKFALPSERQMSSLGHWLLTNGYRYGRKFDRDAPGIKGHNEAALPSRPTACPGDTFPLGHIRAWYQANVKKVEAIGGGLLSFKDCEDLAHYLERLHYWGQSKAAVLPKQREVALVWPNNAKVLVLGPDNVRDLGGRTFVSLRDLAEKVGWEEPTMDTEGRVIQRVGD